MHPFEVEEALKTLTILIDTREQPTTKFKERIASMGVPTERRKLNFGDYSAAVTLPDGAEYSLQNAVCVERKMDLDELCSCYCQERKRFQKEFDRAKESGAKMYLLIENATWEKVYRGNYRSMMKPAALLGSLTAYLARYNCTLIFCAPETSGRLIKDILYRETKERLENL